MNETTYTIKEAARLTGVSLAAKRVGLTARHLRAIALDIGARR